MRNIMSYHSKVVARNQFNIAIYSRRELKIRNGLGFGSRVVKDMSSGEHKDNSLKHHQSFSKTKS